VFCSAVGSMCEIEPDFLRFDEIIGEGQFGDVYRGTYTALVCNFYTCIQQLLYLFVEVCLLHYYCHYAVLGLSEDRLDLL